MKTDKESDQRLLIRARLASRLLPCGPAHQVYGGLGTQAVCSCCDRRIGSDQIEFEVQLKTVSGASRQLLMHSECFRLWSDESELTRSTHTAQAAS